MNKYRLKFSKNGKMIYIGHLDLLKFFIRLIKRTQLPIAYSNGFNPHQCNQALPSGIEILKVRELKEGEKNCASAIVAADYKVCLDQKIENLKDIIDEILSEKNIVLEREVKKKFKTVDIRPMIYSLEVDNSGENSIINTRIATGSQGNLKIDLLMEYIYKKCNIEYIPIKLKTTRYEMYTEKDGELVAL